MPCLNHKTIKNVHSQLSKFENWFETIILAGIRWQCVRHQSRESTADHKHVHRQLLQLRHQQVSRLLSAKGKKASKRAPNCLTPRVSGEDEDVPVHLQLQGAQPSEPQFRVAASMGGFQGQAADCEQGREKVIRNSPKCFQANARIL